MSQRGGRWVLVDARSWMAMRQGGRVRFGVFAGLLSVVLSVSVLGGCSMGKEPVYVARASLPASVLEDGELVRITRGAIFWDDDRDVSIPFGGYGSDDQGPVAHIGVGSAKKQIFGQSYRLHVGESVEVPGIGTVTLVSFDRIHSDTQGITILFKPEPEMEE